MLLKLDVYCILSDSLIRSTFPTPYPCQISLSEPMHTKCKPVVLRIGNRSSTVLEYRGLEFLTCSIVNPANRIKQDIRLLTDRAQNDTKMPRRR